jgi:hypothetical protein
VRDKEEGRSSDVFFSAPACFFFWSSFSFSRKRKDGATEILESWNQLALVASLDATSISFSPTFPNSTC